MGRIKEYDIIQSGTTLATNEADSAVDSMGQYLSNNGYTIAKDPAKYRVRIGTDDSTTGDYTLEDNIGYSHTVTVKYDSNL